MTTRPSSTEATRYVCPTCSGPLFAEKGSDWMTLACPTCKKSYKWRGSPAGIVIRVVFILIFVGDWILMFVDAHWRASSFRQILAVVALVAAVWLIVGLIQMWRTSAKWKRQAAA